MTNSFFHSIRHFVPAYFLSELHGVSLGCGWSRWPLVMEVSNNVLHKVYEERQILVVFHLGNLTGRSNFSQRECATLGNKTHSSVSLVISSFLFLSPLIPSSKGDMQHVCASSDIIKFESSPMGTHRKVSLEVLILSIYKFYAWFEELCFENHVINIDITCHWKNILIYVCRMNLNSSKSCVRLTSVSLWLLCRVSPFSPPCPIVFRMYVFIRRNIEKDLSLAILVIGRVANISAE
jgi:hypothetical protein